MKSHFEAAHTMPGYPVGHPNSRLHGHSYEVALCVEGDIRGVQNYVAEFSELHRVLETVCRKLDHQNLNDFLEAPSGEALAWWIADRVLEPLKDMNLQCVWVRVMRPTIGLEIEVSPSPSLGVS